MSVLVQHPPAFPNRHYNPSPRRFISHHHSPSAPPTMPPTKHHHQPGLIDVSLLPAFNPSPSKRNNRKSKQPTTQPPLHPPSSDEEMTMMSTPPPPPYSEKERGRKPNQQSSPSKRPQHAPRRSQSIKPSITTTSLAEQPTPRLSINTTPSQPSHSYSHSRSTPSTPTVAQTPPKQSLSRRRGKHISLAFNPPLPNTAADGAPPSPTATRSMPIPIRKPVSHSTPNAPPPYSRSAPTINAARNMGSGRQLPLPDWDASPPPSPTATLGEGFFFPPFLASNSSPSLSTAQKETGIMYAAPSWQTAPKATTLPIPKFLLD